ncbi:MAG: hypothetical protein ACXADY_26640 [Candidatus Hodarchaeales archaeon]|jgi:DNA-binding transcriptional ArsR family regulator
MSNKGFRDVISYEEALFKVLRDKKTLEIFKNKNLAYLLKFLRDYQRPMTVKELEDAFKEESRITGNKNLEKSDKTIYRYLGKLEKTGLVIQAGVRMYPEKTKSQTLYGRPAKLFLPDYSITPPVSPKTKEEESKVTKGVEILIRNYFGYEKTSESEAKINELIQKFTRDFYDKKIQLVEKSEGEIDEVMKDLDPRFQIDSIFSKACTFILLSENDNWYKAIKDCFKSSP